MIAAKQILPDFDATTSSVRSVVRTTRSASAFDDDLWTQSRTELAQPQRVCVSVIKPDIDDLISDPRLVTRSGVTINSGRYATGQSCLFLLP